MTAPGAGTSSSAAASEPSGREPALGGLGPRVARLTGTTAAGLAPLGSEHQWGNYQVRLADGRLVFVKAADADLGGIFEAEARGLRWLAEAHTVGVPEVLGWDVRTLAVAWVPEQARPFGRSPRARRRRAEPAPRSPALACRALGSAPG